MDNSKYLTELLLTTKYSYTLILCCVSCDHKNRPKLMHPDLFEGVAEAKVVLRDGRKQDLAGGWWPGVEMVVLCSGSPRRRFFHAPGVAVTSSSLPRFTLGFWSKKAVIWPLISKCKTKFTLKKKKNGHIQHYPTEGKPCLMSLLNLRALFKWQRRGKGGFPELSRKLGHPRGNNNIPLSAFFHAECYTLNALLLSDKKTKEDA